MDMEVHGVTNKRLRFRLPTTTNPTYFFFDAELILTNMNDLIQTGKFYSNILKLLMLIFSNSSSQKQMLQKVI